VVIEIGIEIEIESRSEGFMIYPDPDPDPDPDPEPEPDLGGRAALQEIDASAKMSASRGSLSALALDDSQSAAPVASSCRCAIPVFKPSTGAEHASDPCHRSQGR
jgi:hypothetical protein